MGRNGGTADGWGGGQAGRTGGQGGRAAGGLQPGDGCGGSPPTHPFPLPAPHPPPNLPDPFPVALLAAAQSHGVGAALAPLVTPAADFFAAQGLPSALIKYGHPGNMAVVLGAMGLYGCGYLGAVIRTSSDKQAVKAARDLHPKLGAGMAIFFALGATGGLMSLAMQGKPLAESPHAITGVTGLVLLAFQAMLPLFFTDDPSTRTAHAYFGASLLALFTVHAGLGVKLALSL